MNFEEIYIKHYRKLFCFAFQCTLSKHDSEDLVQETFTRFLKEIRRGTEINNTQAWLYKVLTNLINTNKSRAKQQIWKLKQNGSAMQSEDFQTEYSSDEKKRIISGELKQMPSDERKLLILYNRGLKYEEIAEILDMNPNSVGTTLARTIQKFRNTLKTKYHELFE